MTLFQALPIRWQDLMVYDRMLIGHGELWRLITANFIHLGWGHLILNAAGLLVMAWLFAENRKTSQWGIDLLICGLATSGGLYLLNPDVIRCVGLSGALHGLFVIGALDWIKKGDPQGKWLILCLAAKLTWEQTRGEMPFSGPVIGGEVVTDAHLWGAIGGLIAWLAGEGWRRMSARL